LPILLTPSAYWAANKKSIEPQFDYNLTSMLSSLPCLGIMTSVSYPLTTLYFPAVSIANCIPIQYCTSEHSRQVQYVYILTSTSLFTARYKVGRPSHMDSGCHSCSSISRGNICTGGGRGGAPYLTGDASWNLQACGVTFQHVLNSLQLSLHVRTYTISFVDQNQHNHHNLITLIDVM
jgi:hypothetical protein